MRPDCESSESCKPVKVTMVIPSYWSRESTVGPMAGDAVYDHPTPLDHEGTLLRTLQSLNVLQDSDFQVVVIAAATATDIETRVEEQVAGVIKSVSVQVDVFLWGATQLRKVYDLLAAGGKQEYIDLLQLRGYSNIRNLCLFIPHILESDMALLIDDDEVFEDPAFMSKAKEFVGQRHQEMRVDAVAGFYLQGDGGYRVRRESQPWMQHWDQYAQMNAGFEQIIATEPRLKETPFVFGGNMAVHKNLFTVVPFDPNVRRGEDIDYLINARMFGFRFFLDNQLAIKHLPPGKSYPVWRRLREDIYRFVYERAKLNSQVQVEGMTRVYPEDLAPYPGAFLQADLDMKIERSCKLLSEEYLAAGDSEGSEEALRNITLARTDAVPKFDAFQNMCKLQKRWQQLLAYTGSAEIRSQIREDCRVGEPVNPGVPIGAKQG